MALGLVGERQRDRLMATTRRLTGVCSLTGVRSRRLVSADWAMTCRLRSGRPCQIAWALIT